MMTELSHKIFTQSANNPQLIVLKPLLVCFRSEKKCYYGRKPIARKGYQLRVDALIKAMTLQEFSIREIEKR